MKKTGGYGNDQQSMIKKKKIFQSTKQIFSKDVKIEDLLSNNGLPDMAMLHDLQF